VAEWEYRKLFLNLHPPRGDELNVLNAAGSEGWELVSITGNNVAYLKREADEVALPTSSHTQEATANGNHASAAGPQGATVKYRDPVTQET
jgi:hypothetical protein